MILVNILKNLKKNVLLFIMIVGIIFNREKCWNIKKIHSKLYSNNNNLNYENLFIIILIIL